VLWIVAIGAWRSLNTEPFMIRYAARPDEVRAAARRSLGCTWLAGLALGVIMIATAELVAAPYRTPMQVLGVALPFLLLQDTGRVIGFTMFRTVASAVSDLAWAVMLALALGGLVVFGPPTTPMWAYLASWAVTGVAASALILQQLRLVPDLGVVNNDTVENLRMGAPLLVNYLLTGAPTYVLFLVTPAVASLAELGLLRAAYVPYGPFGVLLQGMQLVALPYAMKRATPAKVIRLAYPLSMGLAVAGVLWGAVVMFVVPDGLGTWLLGDLWVPSETTRALFAVATVGDALTTGPLLALRALRAPGRLVRIRLWAGPLTFLLGLSLLPVLGAEGAGIAIVVGFAATLVLAVVHLRRIAAEEPTGPTDATDDLGRIPA
jgi:hypothetical protein